MTDTTQGDTEIVKARVAKHELLDQAGNVVDNEESAHGIRYTLLANSQAVDYVFGKNADQDRMFALFGAKTLATNESSQARNNPKGAGGADEQIQAVRDRFALTATGVWVDRTREGVGAKVDLDALAESMCVVFVRQGKKTQAEVDGGYKATIRQKLEDDAAWARKARNVPEFATEYARIKGRATATVDDMLA